MKSFLIEPLEKSLGICFIQPSMYRLYINIYTRRVYGYSLMKYSLKKHGEILSLNIHDMSLFEVFQLNWLKIIQIKKFLCTLTILLKK